MKTNYARSDRRTVTRGVPCWEERGEKEEELAEVGRRGAGETKEDAEEN